MDGTRTLTGKYLRHIRLKSGYDSVGDYHRAFRLPISENYYRELENGKESSNKKLSIEKAVELAKYLPTGELGNLKVLNDPELSSATFSKDEQHDLIYFVLRDLLGDDASKAVLKSRTETLFEDFLDFSKTMQLERRLMSDAYALQLEKMQNSYIPSDAMIEYFQQHFEQLALVHFAYLRNQFSFDELLEVAIKNKISDPASSCKNFIKRCCDKKGSHYCRKKKIFKLSGSSAGQELKAKFILHETQHSLAKGNNSRPFSNKGTFDYSTITAFTESRLQKLRDILITLIAEMGTRSCDLDEHGEKANVIYVSLHTSPRPQYDISGE